MDCPAIDYATTVDGLSIAYQRFGSGEFDVVYLPGTVSHLEMAWEFDGTRYSMERFASFCRFLKFDKRGTGLSDRHMGTGTPEARIDDVRAVMDAEGIERAVVLGHSEGGTLAALFAALHPERVDRLVLFNAYSYGPLCRDHPKPASGRRVAEMMLDRLRREWGTGRALSMWAEGVTDIDAAARYERSACTPAGIVQYMDSNFRIDVRPVLPLVQAPTLVVHGTHDQIIPFFFAELFEERIPHAELVPVDMGHGSFGREGNEAAHTAIETWLTGQDAPEFVPVERVLSTVLFTDLVGSTAMATRLGDASWKRLLDRHDDVCRRAVEQHRGHLVKLTGDGILATFDGPGRAIDCAKTIAVNLEGIDLRIRAGIHTGEIELRHGDIGGIAVNMAARVMSAAFDGEVWVTSTVPSLVVGSGHQFSDRGDHELKGIPGSWTLAAAS